MTPRPAIIVFADVDGILRHADARAFSDAANALQGLRRDHIPLVLCSGKTRAEIEAIHQELQINHPFVCEHGGAAFIPAGYFGFDVPCAREVGGYHALEFGRPYVEVVQSLHRAADRLRIDIVGFDDMSVEAVARECHVPLLQARLAKLREYGERFRILDSSETTRLRLFRALKTARLRCIAGERYHHTGALVNNNAGVELLRTLYQRARGAVFTVGLADATAENHALQSVNHRVSVSDVTLASGSGVLAWAETIINVVQELRVQQRRRALTLVGGYDDDGGRAL